MDEAINILGNAARDGLEASINAALPGTMVTRWVGVVEIMDTDGARALLMVGDGETAVWDRLGLLEFGLTRERATIDCPCEEDD